MAASDKEDVLDYEWDFVDIDGYLVEFDCQQCRRVLREPILTECCGQNFCRACIDPAVKDSKPCPFCGEAEFNSLRNKKTERKIFALDVYCPMRNRGCLWIGELRKRDEHLRAKDSCEYFDVPCPQGCCEAVQRRHLTKHLESDCPKRAYLCEHCDFKATYEVVSGHHWPQCAKYPLPCPNQCGVDPVERCQFDRHLQECPLQVVECEYRYAGCEARVQLQAISRHMEDAIQSHLKLVSVAAMKSSQELQESLTRQRVEMQKALHEKDRELQVKDAQILELNTALRETVAENKALRERVRDLEDLQGMRSFSIEKVSDYKKAQSEWWYSPDFYSHNEGYMLRLAVVVNSDAGGGAMSVYLCVREGEFDDALKWPQKVQATVQLVDMTHGHQPYRRVLTSKTGTKGYRSIIEWRPFITHTELDDYIHEDTLHFRVRVELLD